MAPWESVLLVSAVSAFAMLVAWWRQRRSHNAGWVDVVWSACMGATAIFYAVVGTGAALPRSLVGLLGGLWGLRLAWHLARRVAGEGEDGRYRHLRAHWQGDQRKFLGFYLGQAVSVALFSLPFLATASNPRADVGPWTVAGIAIWAIALGGEAVADAQLAAWRHDPGNRGRTCRAGLWRWSRHPNYFFEWLHWFAWVALAVGSPFAWLAWLGPLLMGASLAWFTGIPFTEAQALRSRGEDYRAYQRETSAFFPWFPRKAS